MFWVCRKILDTEIKRFMQNKDKSYAKEKVDNLFILPRCETQWAIERFLLASNSFY